MKAQKSILLILNYHHVTKLDDQKSLYDVSLASLESHFKIIQDEGLKVSSLGQDSCYEANEPFKVALTFDDGNHSDYDLVLPTLAKFDFTASFFPLANYVNKPGRLTSIQLRELAEKGHHIGSHGLSHEILTKASAELQEKELKDSKAQLEQITGKEITSFAFPYGHSNDDLVSKAFACGYKHLFSTGMRSNLNNDKPNVFYRWNVTNKTSLDLFQKVISSKGEISPASDLQNRLQNIGV